MKASGPVSVVLPPGLRARVGAEAKRRGLKLSPAIRALVAERVAELDETETMTRAEEWQRAQAWAAWDAAQHGDNPEVGWDDLEAELERGVRAPTPPRSRSRRR